MITNAKEGAPRIQPHIRQAHLSGPSRRLDPRVNAVRPDLVDIGLAGTVIAPRFAAGTLMSCGRTTAMLHAAPDYEAVAISALLPGEDFTVFDLAHGWAWGQCAHDAYVGWVRASALGAAIEATHRVIAPAASVFASPGIKSQVMSALPFNARLAAREIPATQDFIATLDGFVHRRHVAPLAETGDDPARLALGFVGTPYVWGGRTRDGIDCSGLTQAVLLACGIACPRDSDQQAAAFLPIEPADRRRGDLVVFPGHVGILADADTLIHANAWWMATVAEPLADAVKRLTPTGFRHPA